MIWKLTILALTFTPPAHADLTGVCRKTAWAVGSALVRAGEGSLQYGAEVLKTGGVRIILKPPTNSSPPNTRWAGFWSSPPEANFHFFNWMQFSPFRKIAEKAWGEPFDFTPIRGLTENLVHRPTRWTTSKMGRELEWTHLSRFLASVGLGTWIWAWIDDEEKELKAKKLLEKVEERAALWNRFNRYDSRYEDIRGALQSGAVTEEESRLFAVQRNLLLHAYYDVRLKHPEVKPEQFLELPFFERALQWKEKGFSSKKGYRTLSGFSETISDEQLAALVQHRHDSLAVMELVSLWIQKSPDLETLLKKNPRAKDLLHSIEHSPFNQSLERMERAGTIDREERGMYLQQDIEWEETTKEWTTLRVEKLKKQNGIYLEEKLTLEDLRKEILQDIELKR